MAKSTFLKTPTEIETFGVDYTDRLSNEIITNDTLSTTAWSVPAGITKVSDAIDQANTRTVIKLSGGTDETDYVLTNTVTTTGGRTLVEKIVIKVRE